jgi:hypothetical protein
MESNQRMGLSALGFDTKAIVQGCVITGSTEHGIAQGQGAEVRVANNTVKDNKDKDIFGNVHDFGTDAHKPSASAAAAASKGKAVGIDRKSEHTPLVGGGTKAASAIMSRRIKMTIVALVVCAIAFGAVYTFVSYERLKASPSTPQKAGKVPRGAKRKQ